MKNRLERFFRGQNGMEKSIFNKKRWLLSRSDLILSLKQDGMTNKQVIEHLKSAEKMPFDLDESLFSRHCKAILEQLDFKKSNASLTDKVQNLEKYTRYLESNNKNLILKNKELRKPKQKEPLRPVEPINNEYIDDLKNQLSQKNQELEQCQADLAQQQQNAVYIAKLEERFLQRKQDLQQCQADLEQREITIAQNGDLITDLKNQLSQSKQVEVELSGKNQALVNERYELKLAVKRLNDEIGNERSSAKEIEEKWRTTQNKAKYMLYFAYCFAAMSVLLFVLFLGVG